MHHRSPARSGHRVRSPPSSSPPPSRRAGSLAAAPARRAPRPTSRPRTPATTTTPRWSPRSRPPRPPTRTSSRSARSARATRAATSGRPRSATTSATDEDEPEVLFDALHHAREHLTVEQALAILRWLTDGYGTDAADHDARRHARDLDRLRGQPGRRRVRPDRQPVPLLAQEPPAERRARPRSAPTSTATTATTGAAAAARRVASRPRPTAARRPSPRRRRGPCATSWTAGSSAAGSRSRPPSLPHQRRAGAVAVRLHEDRHPAGHDRRRPRRARRARPGDGRPQRLHGRAVERPVHHRRRRDRLDVRRQRIFMYTFEMYPSAQPRSARPRGTTRPTSSSGRETTRNRDAVLYLIERGRLPVRGDRQGRPVLRAAVRRLRDSTAAGRATRTGPTPRPPARGSAANPAATTPPGRARCTSGVDARW